MTKMSLKVWEAFDLALKRGMDPLEAFSLGIAADRMDRDEKPVEEGPCSNPHAGCQKRIEELEIELKLTHQALEGEVEGNRNHDRVSARDRAYIALDVLRLETYHTDTPTLRTAASKFLLDFLGYEVRDEDELAADVEPAPQPAPRVPGTDPYPDDQGY